MAEAFGAFREFELAGWANVDVVLGYHEQISVVTVQVSGPLLDAAGVQNGARVLDVATGAGYVAAAAKIRRAIPVGLDFSPAQVALARKTSESIRFEVADAEVLPFEDGEFDAVVCAFGMCHFPNPGAAVQEAARVLKSGGRFAFAVWDTPDRAVGFGAINAAIGEHGARPTDLPPGPDFFRFSTPAESLKTLEDAGFVSLKFQHVPQLWRLADADQLYTAITGGSVRAAATIQAQTQAAREEIRRAIKGSVESWKVGDHYEIPMPAVVASGVKP